MSFGVTPTGFVRKTLAEIIDSLETGWRGIFGSDVDLSADTPDAQILGTVSAELDEAWQALEAIDDSFNPSTAQGAALSQIVQFNGINRLEGTRTRVNVQLAINPAPVALDAGARVRSVNGDVFQIVSPGVFFNGDSTLFEAVEDGPILVGVGEITEIVTPKAWWNGVSNSAAQTVIGSLDETDGALRVRREASTERGATNILESLYGVLLSIEGVSRVRVYVNDTNGTVDGRDPHSYEVVIVGGTDLLVAEGIWSRHPAGIELIGTTAQAITDSQGFSQTINFTRPTDVPIFVSVTVSATSDYPVTGDDDIKQAIVDYAAGDLVEGEEFGIGDHVLLSRLYSAVNSVPGHHATALTIGFTTPGVGTSNLTIDETEIAQFLVANITVTS